jgi:hypothetical protein
MAKTDYLKEGQVELKSGIWTVVFITENEPIVLENADISECYFIEDIFKFSMVGKLVFNDRFNLMELSPFSGNEKIAIIYSVGRKRRELIFDIWKVVKISQVGSGINEADENIISIDFVDPYFAALTLRKYSKSWSNKYYSDIMKDILNNMLFYGDDNFKFDVEESSNRTDFIIPYWYPQTALRWLLRRGVGRQSGTSGYLCFNNTREGFRHNLLTFNYLLLDIGRTIDRLVYNFDSSTVSSENKILEWWINSLDRNSNPRIRGGVWKGWNFEKKKLLNQEYVYSKGVSENVMLGRKTLYPKMDDTLSSNIVIGGRYDELESVAFNDWCKRYNLQFILNIIVEGNEKRYAGQHIEIEWPSVVKDTFATRRFNDLLKGKYLIKSVTHSFSAGGSLPYKQRLVCIKNAYHNAKRSKILHPSDVTNLYTEKFQQILGQG